MSVAGGVSYVYVNDALAPYAVNNFVDGDPMYIGKAAPDGTWLVIKFSPTTGVMGYANLSNNSSYTTYTAAWAAYASLTYGGYQTLTGV
jgi:hypothetical protein